MLYCIYNIVILNFHGIGLPRCTKDANEHLYWIDQTFFESILDLIVGRSNVWITVDDGNISDFNIILPALLRRNLKATFFVCAGRLGNPDFLDKNHLLELLAQGMTIGSHGMNHIAWRHLSPETLKCEIVHSKSILENICGQNMDSAACPFGAYDRTVLKSLRTAGYNRIYTSDTGNAFLNKCIFARNSITSAMNITEVRHLVLHGPSFFQQCYFRIRSYYKQIR